MVEWHGKGDREMKVGDLIRLKSHGHKHNRLAEIIETAPYLNCVKIIFLDDGRVASALTSNISEIYEGVVTGEG